MRLSLAFAILIFFASCDEQANKARNPKPEFEESVAKPEESLTSEKDSLPKKEFPYLTDENAEDFLRKYFQNNPERKILVKTNKGNLKLRLFDETPIHSANFLMLVKRGYFNDNKFTRVVKDFIVQGGNSDSEEDELDRMLIGSYKLKPEFNSKLLHKAGAVSQARQYKGNPEKLSSPYNFFFVEGRTFNEPQLLAMERDNNISIPQWKRSIYETTGGAPHLDNEHTVFGEIYEGMEVLKALANTPTDKSEWPKEPLTMSMEVID